MLLADLEIETYSSFVRMSGLLKRLLTSQTDVLLRVLNLLLVLEK
jgi:hypothetical protein